jgi:protein SCO1/2
MRGLAQNVTGQRRAPSRRAVLLEGASFLVAPSWMGPAAVPTAPAPVGVDEHGRVNPPRPPPDVPVLCHDGKRTSLRALVRGRVTAFHPMFTSCAATCPIQGAVLAKVQKLLPDRAARGIQIVSLSIDPRRDTPEALQAWLARFRAGPGWIAAAPVAESDLPALRAFSGPGRNAADPHTTRVLVINRQGLLVWRTFDLPDAAEIADVLRHV